MRRPIGNGSFSPGGSASVPSIIETHVGFVMQLLDRVAADRVALEPDRSAELLAEIHERASNTVWGTGGCTSWYLDANGVPLVNPILLDDLEADMARPDFRRVPRHPPLTPRNHEEGLMGIIATSSETTFTHSAEELYDFVTDPRNWPKTYPGSAGIEGVDTADLPLEVGAAWSEAGRLGDLDCRYTWRLVTAIRPWRFEFRSIGMLAHDPDDHSGGFEGITTISYTFTESGAGVTLFQRSMTTEVPKHGRMPAQVVAAHEPFAIDAYHDAVATALG